jgi:diaminohydroxyphosphoribosylaminopyrimidine deaminase/5-amino-6-(5-phosphoribosylamino)uracil reductase
MHSFYLNRCIELAQLGKGTVSPNPLVGCVIVHNNLIIGEGWHRQFGGPHAEVNAILSVKNKELLPQSTLYVNLEPCCHFGKTPPCTNLILQSGIKKVVVGMVDPNPNVAGKGIAQLRQNGVEVITDVLTHECTELNKRFIWNQTKQQVYVILKWAQTANCMLAPDAAKLSPDEFEKQRHITGKTIQMLVHKWRTQEDAIMVGTNTALTDNPALNNRAWPGKAPVRVVLDQHLRLPHHLKIFDNSQTTLIVNAKQNKHVKNTIWLQLDFSTNWQLQLVQYLYQKMGLGSLIVEGGQILLTSFIQQQLFNEIQVFTSKTSIEHGVKAPNFSANLTQTKTIDGVTLNVFIP